jgi:hypothetical protein
MDLTYYGRVALMVKLPNGKQRKERRGKPRTPFQKILDWVEAHFVLITIFMWILVLGGTYLISDEQSQSEKEIAGQALQDTRDTRLIQFEACIKNGNSLRNDMRAEFVDVKQDVIIPGFKIARKVFESFITLNADAGGKGSEVLREATKRLTKLVQYSKRRIANINKRIPNVDCLMRYPALDGQIYPKDLIKEAKELTSLNNR